MWGTDVANDTVNCLLSDVTPREVTLRDFGYSSYATLRKHPTQPAALPDTRLMPSFQNPMGGTDLSKRKRDDRDVNPRPDKRPNIGQGAAVGQRICWMVQWFAYRLFASILLLTEHRRAPQYKKHKTWDGDGVLVIDEGSAQLFDLDGKS